MFHSMEGILITQRMKAHLFKKIIFHITFKQHHCNSNALIAQIVLNTNKQTKKGLFHVIPTLLENKSRRTKNGLWLRGLNVAGAGGLYGVQMANQHRSLVVNAVTAETLL